MRMIHLYKISAHKKAAKWNPNVSTIAESKRFNSERWEQHKKLAPFVYNDQLTEQSKRDS